ncbi:helix-turn-helix domain-containing protein [Neptunomonas sp.]|uniref:winged helix-turn-helix transcriptional regulator n=1 Tax=Neptunomonas sp. TaxID=1971898 RepID=UPI0025E515CA|nr:helix-turn-helix domain-containing protein [Neptunomonas sp.]
MKTNEKKILRRTAPVQATRMVEAIFGCKWSLTVFTLLTDGVNRPGEMVRSVEGLSTKVLNECLRRHIEFGILQKTSFAEIPPRVEYEFTPFGRKFLKVVGDIEQLQQDIGEAKHVPVSEGRASES